MSSATNRWRIAAILSLMVWMTIGTIKPALAQEKSNKGKDFWLGFMAHVEGTNAGMSLYITSDSSTSGTVSVPGQSWSTTFSVTANSLTVVTIPSSVAYVGCSDCITNKAVHVTSLKDVIVYAHHYEGNKSDATLILPTQTQGKEYYVMAYEQSSPGNTGRSEFMVVASKDSTVVKIKTSVDLLSATGGIISAGTTFYKVLDAGEVYQAQARYGTAAYDISGTHIEVIDTGATANCRTIAVFSGSSYTSIGGCTSGFGINSGDNLLEQMYPINSWGKTFVLVPALGRVSDNFRFVGSVNNTQILIYKSVGTPDIIYVNKGEFAEVKNVSEIRAVVASQPIMVAQFQKTSKCDGSGNIVGDPSMTILNPMEQTLTDITLYSSRFFDIDNHYINVVIPSHAVGTFRIDGSSVSFTAVPRFSSLSYARIQVSAGNHRLTAAVGFVATAYGEGDYESYGYAAGANVKALIATINVANSPLTTEVSNCLGTPTKFRGNAEYTVVRWEWDFGDGNTDSVQNPNHVYADTGSYRVKLYTYKPQFDGCSNYDSAFVNVNVYAAPTAILHTENLCDSVKAVFADSSVVAAPETYLATRWNINGGADQYGRTIKQLFDTTGTFQIRMITITNHQCRDTVTDSFTISPNPVAYFSAANACYFDSTEFIDLSSIDTGAVSSWIWSFEGTDTSYMQNPRFYFADSGYHSVTLTAISDSGCVGSYTDSVYKLPRFDVSFSFNDTCFGIQSDFTNTTILDGGQYTDTLWTTSESDTFFGYHMSKIFQSAGTHWVRLVMEQDSYCRDTFERSIEINPLAAVDFSVEKRCYGDSTTYMDISSSSNAYQRSWDLDDGFAGTDSVVYATYGSFGDKQVTLSITTEFGCISSLSKTVRITRPRILDLAAVDQCEGVSQLIAPVLSSGLDSFSAYNWKVNGSSVSTDSTFTYVFTPEGRAYLSLDLSTSNGCSLSFLDSIMVYDVPVADFLVDNVCANGSLRPVDQSSSTAPWTITSYRWKYDGATASTIQMPVLAPGSVGSHQLELIVGNQNGCKDTFQRGVLVHAVPQPALTIQDQCLGDVTRFSDNSSIVSGNLASYRWTIDGASYNGKSTSHSFATTGSYALRLVVTSDSGCVDSLDQNVQIHPLPSLDVGFTVNEGCQPFVPTLYNNSTISSGSIQEFRWNWGNGDASTGTLPVYAYQNPGSYLVQVIARSDQGCVDSTYLSPSVLVHANPVADFNVSPDIIHIIITRVDLTDASSADVVNWDWDVEGSLYSGPTVGHYFQTAGDKRVTLTVTNGNGCTDTEEKYVYVNDSLFVYLPDAFTPNGDNINDSYGLSGVTSAVGELNMEIYNRWGELIFESNDPNIRWDGRYKGVRVQEGNYLVKLRYTDHKRRRWYYHSKFITLLIPPVD